MKTKPKSWMDLFKLEEVKVERGDMTNKVMVLNPAVLKPEYQTREDCLWKATSGFGCNPDAIGRAVFATSLKDGEHARWSRADFIGEFIGILPETK